MRIAHATIAILSIGAGVVAPAWGATGAQLYQACAACHGARGEGNAQVGAPAIAGQSAPYLQRQLVNFRGGLRGKHPKDTFGAQMRAANQAVLADDRSIAAVVAYVAALPRTVVRAPATYDARRGNNLYQGTCGACHGAHAEGNEALGTPRLAGLDATYLKRQLANFRDGVRGADPKDTYGRQMASMSKIVAKDADVEVLLAHIHALGAAK